MSGFDGLKMAGRQWKATSVLVGQARAETQKQLNRCKRRVVTENRRITIRELSDDFGTVQKIWVSSENFD